MSETPTCATCRYLRQDPEGVLECHRSAPPVHLAVEGDRRARATWWPWVASNDWCGDWKATGPSRDVEGALVAMAYVYQYLDTSSAGPARQALARLQDAFRALGHPLDPQPPEVTP